MTEVQTTIGAQVAKADNTPKGLIVRYAADFRQILPSHINADAWIRQAQAALRKGPMLPGKTYTALEEAAAESPGTFFSALLDAASQGLKPGTAEYYLTPRKNRGKNEVLGMRGYQGEIEMIYRAGACSSVIAEVVYTGDTFAYRPGQEGPPLHEIDWDATDRGTLRLVYAFAWMRGGGISKVIVMNAHDMARIKGFAQGTDRESSPWRTSTDAMWLKSAIHQLQKWVPTSAEYRHELRVDAAGLPALQSVRDIPGVDPGRNGDTEVEYVEIVGDEEPPQDEPAPAAVPAPQPRPVAPVAPPEPQGQPVAVPAQEVVEAEVVDDEPGPPPVELMGTAQRATLHSLMRSFGVRDDDKGRASKLAACSEIVGHPIGSTNDLTAEEAAQVIGTLQSIASGPGKADEFSALVYANEARDAAAQS